MTTTMTPSQQLTPSPAVDALIERGLAAERDSRAQESEARAHEAAEAEARIAAALGPIWGDVQPHATPTDLSKINYQKPLLRYDVAMPGLSRFVIEAPQRGNEVQLSSSAGDSFGLGKRAVTLKPSQGEGGQHPWGTGPLEWEDSAPALAPFFLYLRASYEYEERRRDADERRERAKELSLRLVHWDSPVAETQEEADRILAEMRELLPEEDADHVKLYNRWLALRAKRRREEADERVKADRRQKQETAEWAYAQAYAAYLTDCLAVLDANRALLAPLQAGFRPQPCWTLCYALLAEGEDGECSLDTRDALVLDAGADECGFWAVLNPAPYGGARVSRVRFRHVVCITEREPLDWAVETRCARAVPTPDARRSVYFSPDLRFQNVTEDEVRQHVADLGLSPLPAPPPAPAHLTEGGLRSLLSEAAGGHWPDDAGPLPTPAGDDSLWYEPADED